MSDEIGFLTIAEGGRRLARGTLTSAAWTARLLARIAALNPKLSAFIAVTEDAAMKAAHEADARRASGNAVGPLDGVPLALKDVIDQQGLRTSGASFATEGHIAALDATVTARLKQAGAVLLGKLNTHEFAQGGPSADLPWPCARNPWDTERFTGSTSSGAGAAIAAGLVPGALGTDQGGSVRHPAAHCGLAGLKPTNGLVSPTGAIPNSYAFDAVGPMAWTVEDCALLLDAIAETTPRTPPSSGGHTGGIAARLAETDLKGLRLGLVRAFHADGAAQPDVAAAVERAAEALAKLGCVVDEVTLPPLADFAACQWTVTAAELNAVHEHTLRTMPDRVGANTRFRLAPGALTSAVDYLQAMRLRRRLIETVNGVLQNYDALISATQPVTAPLIRDMTDDAIFRSRGAPTMAFSVTDGPALAVCCGFTETGLPLSFQIAGRAFDDATVLRIGHAYELAHDWRNRRPMLATSRRADA